MYLYTYTPVALSAKISSAENWKLYPKYGRYKDLTARLVVTVLLLYQVVSVVNASINEQ